MENTVDLILRHGNGDPQILVDQLESGIDPRQNSVAVDEELARQLSQGRDDSNSAPAPDRSGKGWPTTLPEDFLRVPGVAPGANSFNDDEALARMLQDELFTEELSRNPDFAHLARGRSNATRPPAAASRSTVNPATAAANRFGEFASRFTGNKSQQQQNGSNRSLNNGSVPQSPNIMDKISEMGDNAKRRLQVLAAQFNASNERNAAAAAGTGTQQSTGAATEFRGLLDEDDDNMELAARKDL